MKKIIIGIFTTTRAEFDLFRPLIEKIKANNYIDYELFVGGSHLKKKYGRTINVIKNNGYKISNTFDFLLDNDSPNYLVKGSAIALKKLKNIFRKRYFDFVCILGDRYELISIVQTAILFGKPIIHIHGGEKTEGAIDEQIRHMITKASHIHFVSCKEYYDNVRKMGEEEWRIFNTGALAVENIKKLSTYSKNKIFDLLKLNNEKTIILTYHPVTIENKLSTKKQIQNIFSALNCYDFQLIITAPNMDSDNTRIFKEIKNQIKNPKFLFIESLGAEKYLSLLKYVDFVIGNSSSGIIEVPYFKIPTINIGNRQEGRIMHKSVINTNYEINSIKKAIEKALNKDFKEDIKKMEYKFGTGKASEIMIDAIFEFSNRTDIMQKKLNYPC